MSDISVKEALSILKDNTADYIAARKELLQIEAKEASSVLGKKLAMVVVLAVVCAFSYFLFWGVAIALGGYLFAYLIPEGCPVGGAVMMAMVVLVLHVIAAVVLLKKLKRKPDFELFGMTKAELRRDKEWLEENN